VTRFWPRRGSAAQGIVGTAGVWSNVTPNWLDLSTTIATKDSFGAFGMGSDPTRSNIAYVGSSYSGVGRTDDYGLTWTKINTGTNGSDLDTGNPWSIKTPSDGSYVLTPNPYSSFLGTFRSTNQGVDWTYNSTPGDVNNVLISTDNPSLVITCPHGSTGSSKYFESTDGGQNWTDLGDAPFGIFGDGSFISTSTAMVLSPTGLWQGVRTGTASWTWTNRMSTLDGPHGGIQMFRDAVNGYFYVGGNHVTTGSGIWRATLASDGASWTQVSTGAGGYGSATIFATATKIYAQGNFATHGTYGPLGQIATRSSGTDWADWTVDAGITNGAHTAAALTDGVRWVLLTANDNAGIWRYIEP
jgi:hypothetical protein